MDSALALEATKLAAEEFRRDYLVASVVVLLVINTAWALAVRSLVKALGAAQEARVADQKEDRGRYEALNDRTAACVDRSTEALSIMANRRRAPDAPKKPEGP